MWCECAQDFSEYVIMFQTPPDAQNVACVAKLTDTTSITRAEAEFKRIDTNQVRRSRCCPSHLLQDGVISLEEFTKAHQTT